MAVEIDNGELGFLDTPDLQSEQLALFQSDLLLERRNPFSVKDGIKALEGANHVQVLVVDIGGTAIKYNLGELHRGKINIDESRKAIFPAENQGENYISVLQKINTQFKNLPVGISVAGVVNGPDLETSPNVPIFARNLKAEGGFRGILGNRVVAFNDAVAGVIPVAIRAIQEGEILPYFINFICGGGIGGAGLDTINNIVISLEPGHTPATSESNPNSVTDLCLLYPNYRHVCIERIAASGAIEKQWEKLTGNKLTAIEIERLMHEGNTNALKLYDASSRLLAHTIEGVRQRLNFDPGQTVVFLHGGGFKAKGMIERIEKTLNKHHSASGGQLKLLSPKSFGNIDVCFAGAAIAAGALDIH